MYGEKTEGAEKLRLDLEDVKEMYKMQIVQLTLINISVACTIDVLYMLCDP